MNRNPTAAQVMTAEEAKRQRVMAVPPFLRRRVGKDEALPEVELSREGVEGVRDAERLRAVLGFVLLEMKPDLVMELMEALRPRWSPGVKMR